MNFLDILQKLLPFTTTQNGETVFAVFALEPSDWIITVSFILLWSFFLYRIYVSLGEYKHKTQMIRSFVESNHQSFDESFKNIWKNFQNHLIKDSQGHTFRVYDASQFFNTQSIFKTIGQPKFSQTASLLLSLGLLGTFIGLSYGLVQLNLDDTESLKESMSELIHASGAKFASSIWGLGLSIVFSVYEKFLLAKAYQDIVMLQNKINTTIPLIISEQTLLENLSQNKQHFMNNENLLTNLNGIATAHNATSQSGFSVLSNILNQNHSENQKALKGIFDILKQQYQENHVFQQQSLAFFKSVKENQEHENQQLQELTTLTTSLLTVNHDILAENQQQRKNIETLIENNQEQVELLTKQVELLTEQLEVLNSLALDIADNLSQQLKDGLSQAVGEAMKTSIDVLVKNIGGSEENTLHHAITSGTGADFSEKLEQALQEFVDKIKKSTGTDVENINQTIGSISSVTKTLNTDVGNLATQMTELLNAIQSKIDEQANKNSEASDSIKKSAIDAGTIITNALSPISTTLTQFNQLISQVKEHLQTVPIHLETFKDATENLKDSTENTLSASDKLQESSIKLENTSNQLNITVKDFNSSMNELTIKLKLIPTELQGILEVIKQISDNANSTYLELSSQHNQLLTSNQALMTTWIAGLEGYQNKTDDFVKQVLGDMEQHIKQVLKDVENGLDVYKHKSDEHIQSNLAEYDQMIKTFIEKANSLIATTFAKFDGSLGKFATELAGAIDELNGAIEILNQKLQGR